MNSEFIIRTTQTFDKAVQKLARKYPSIKTDLVGLRATLNDNPQSGTALGKDCYKIRMKISSKKTGKSGGARVITYVRIQAKRITLLDIYDKSEQDTITDKELDDLLKLAAE